MTHTGPAPVRAPAPAPAPAPASEWSAYLDAVEAAARAVERLALDPALPAAELAARMPGPVAQPATPWPVALEPRRQEVLAALTLATTTVERRRDSAAAHLAALGRRAPRGATRGYTDGATLDVVG